MTTYTVIAIDPGIDDTSIATFAVPAEGLPVSFERAIAALANVETIRTSPDALLEARLRTIAQYVAAAEHRTLQWWVELPPLGVAAYAGTKRHGRQRSKTPVNTEGLAKLHLAIGAIAAAVSTKSSELMFVPTPRISKLLRRKGVEPHLRPSLMVDHRRGLNDDEIDAIWIGATCMSNPRYLGNNARRALAGVASG